MVLQWLALSFPSTRDSWQGWDVCYTHFWVGSLQGTQPYECENEWLSLYISLWTGNFSSVYRPISPLTWYLLDKLHEPLNVMNWLRRSQPSPMFVECINNMSLQKWFPNYFERFCSKSFQYRTAASIMCLVATNTKIIKYHRSRQVFSGNETKVQSQEETLYCSLRRQDYLTQEKGKRGVKYTREW